MARPEHTGNDALASFGAFSESEMYEPRCVAGVVAEFGIRRRAERVHGADLRSVRFIDDATPADSREEQPDRVSFTSGGWADPESLRRQG